MAKKQMYKPTQKEQLKIEQKASRRAYLDNKYQIGDVVVVNFDDVKNVRVIIGEIYFDDFRCYEYPVKIEQRKMSRHDKEWVIGKSLGRLPYNRIIKFVKNVDKLM